MSTAEAATTPRHLVREDETLDDIERLLRSKCEGPDAIPRLIGRPDELGAASELHEFCTLLAVWVAAKNTDPFSGRLRDLLSTAQWWAHSALDYDNGPLRFKTKRSQRDGRTLAQFVRFIEGYAADIRQAQAEARRTAADGPSR